MRLARNQSVGAMLVVAAAVVAGVLALGQFIQTTPAAPDAPSAASGPTSARRPADDPAAFTENGRRFREYGRPYDQAGAGSGAWAGYADVGGQLAYVARQGDAEFVVYRDEEYGPQRSGGGIIGLQGIAGQLAYLALTPSDVTPVGLGSAVVLGGKNISQAYDYVRDLTAVNGRLTYVGVTFGPDGAEQSVVNYGGVAFGQQYGRVSAPFAYEGELAFLVVGAAEAKAAVVVMSGGKATLLPSAQFDGVAVKDSFDRVVQVVSNGTFRDQAMVDRQLATVAVDDERGRAYARYHGQTYGAEYDDVFAVASVGGKLAFLAAKAGKGVIVYEGQEFGHHYDDGYDGFGEKNDLFALGLPPGTFTVIQHIGDVGGKLTYVATVGFNADGEPKNVVVKEE